MTRFVVDAPAVVRLVRACPGGPGATVDTGGHELLAPTLMRSQVLSLLHRMRRAGELTDTDAEAALAGAGRLPVRLLGDAVLRRRAWRIAARMEWDTTFEAEYVALAQLQGDALVTDDEELAARAADLVPVVPVADLLAALAVRRS